VPTGHDEDSQAVPVGHDEDEDIPMRHEEEEEEEESGLVGELTTVSACPAYLFCATLTTLPAVFGPIDRNATVFWTQVVSILDEVCLHSAP
jgi:hypothetical protein